MRKIKITEQQYNQLVKEGVTLTADVAAANGDINKAVETTKQEAQKSGIDINKAKIEIPAVTETASRTKKELMNEYFSKLKKNAYNFTVEDFIKQNKI